MLRPAPTSISLSSSDVAVAEQKLDIYLGLLKQGFKKDDIIRYFEEHQQAAQPSAPLDEDLRAPSTVELAIRRVRPPVGHVSPPQRDDANPEGQRDASNEADDEDSPPRDASSLAEPVDRFQRHAPRQSSLLRFGQNASPLRRNESSSDLASDFRPPVRTYRPRTDTYSYSQSEISESDLTLDALTLDESDENGPDTRPLSTLRAEAKDFMPGVRRLPLQSLRNSSPLDYNHMLPASLSHDDDAASARSDSAPPRRPLTSTPTTPTGIEGEDEDSVTLPTIPATPTPHRAAGPHNLRSRAEGRVAANNTTTRTSLPPASAQLDGTHLFNVYNDALPPRSQPQTPADLARQPLITERDAAYTAPVGAVHSPSRYFRRERQGDAEEGVQSPTARAMANQGRRVREMERSVRLEVGRMQRDRIRNRGLLQGRFDTEQQNDGARVETHGEVENDDDAEQTAMMTGALDWRDGLNVDRVGTENWEIEEVVAGGGRGPRVVSGNARRFWD